MAEARIAATPIYFPKEDVGTISTWGDIYMSYRHILIRRYFRLRNSIRNGMWPTSSNYLIVACGFSIYLLEMRPNQTQCITDVLLKGMEIIPFSPRIPLRLQNLLFSAGTSIIFFVGLMKLRQYALRMLLSYRGWMYEISNQVSIKTKLWGLWVKLFSGYQPSLYSFQNSLPRLPVPPLHQTLSQLLDSLEPLCTEKEFNTLKNDARHFEKTSGKRLQSLLLLKSYWAPNYVTDWWEKYVYLSSRVPLAINSNYYVVDHYAWTPTQYQTARAANVLHSILYMKRQIDREQLAPLVLRNTIPVCMIQYEKIFSTTRTPGIEVDNLLHYESNCSRHVVVSCKGLLYCMTVYDSANQILCPAILENLFQEIINDATANEASVSEMEKSVAALTGLPRKDWAQIYNSHFMSGLNRESVDVVEKAICMIVLFDKEPKDLSEKGKMLLHGDGKTIWFDKCMNVGFFPSGKCGINIEHSMADAPVPGHVWEYTMTMEVMEKKYLDKGHVMPPPKSFKQKSFAPVHRLHWHMPNELSVEVQKAYEFNVNNNEDLDLVLYNFTTFGKGLIKKVKISPDAFIQLALQLTYFKCTKKFVQTYEASATRLYQHGRTETIRSCTKDSCAFVRAMVDGTKPKTEIFALLQKAGHRHQNMYRDAMNGKGIDRHLFALYVVSRGLGQTNKFLESVLMRPWTLSTSQQPQQQMQYDMPDINLDAFKKMVSPGGGFGPVSDDGYGVSYMLPTDYSIFFHVSSKKSNNASDSQRFVDTLSESMTDMRDLFQDVQLKV